MGKTFEHLDMWVDLFFVSIWMLVDEKENINIDEILDIVEFNTLEECVNYANKIAKEDDIVVMSPASASFDMYKNFEERGNHFKRLVGKL